MSQITTWQDKSYTGGTPGWFTALEREPLLYRVLAARGLTSEEEIKHFLFPAFSRQHDPLQMTGVQPAVDRLRRAIAEGEKILIHGDYDADGLTATAVLYRACRLAGAAADKLYTFVPDREDGYGVGEKALALAQAEGIRLFLTVDCGITAVAEGAALRDMGIDLIITDHHEPGEVLPEALAVINPKQPGCPYPFKELAGVGVAYKLAVGLLGEGARLFLPLVAVGTVADIVPLQDENRLYVKEGLKRLNDDRGLFPGLQALIEVGGLAVDKSDKKKEINSGNIGFVLAPRLNAAGRLETAADPLTLLLSDDRDECGEIALRLDKVNKRRQQEEATMVEQAIAAVDLIPPGIVLYNPAWPHGVVGIAASRLVERFYRPTVLLGRDEDGLLRGSGRSIAGFNLVEALRRCHESGHLLRCGGHKMAAGVALTEEMLPGFATAFAEIASELPKDTFRREIRIDAQVDPEELTRKAMTDLALLAPHGMGNPGPTFSFGGLTVSEARTVGFKSAHLRITAKDGRGKTHAAIMFNGASRAAEVVPGSTIELAFRPALDEYNGKAQISLRVQDFIMPRQPEFLPVTEVATDESDYESRGGIVYNDKAIRQSVAPDRAAMADFYKYLRSQNGRVSLLDYASARSLSLFAAYHAAAAGFKILSELDLLNYEYAGGQVVYTLNAPPEKKRDLTDAPTFTALAAWLSAQEEVDQSD